MLLKSIAIAIAASVVSVLATAPAASAAAPGVSIQGWGSGNCPPGLFCIWPNWNPPPQGPVETPSLMINSETIDKEWTGSIQGALFYNGTGRDAIIYGNFPVSGISFRDCAPAGGTGGELYIPATVTRVTWKTSPC